MNTATAEKLVWEDTARYRITINRYPDAIAILQNGLEDPNRNHLLEAVRGMHGVHKAKFSRRLPSAMLVYFDHRLVACRDLTDCISKRGGSARIIECN